MRIPHLRLAWTAAVGILAAWFVHRGDPTATNVPAVRFVKDVACQGALRTASPELSFGCVPVLRAAFLPGSKRQPAPRGPLQSQPKIGRICLSGNEAL